jgi:hypothetical protein
VEEGVRLLVCGPRNLDATSMPVLTATLRETLLEAVPFSPGFVFAHGAARGADLLWEDALAFTYDRRPALWMPIRRMSAHWEKEGRAAGPLRNQRMLESVQPTYWVAAHWSEEPDTPGTADMVRRLRGAGVPGKVVIVPRPAKESARHGR